MPVLPKRLLQFGLAVASSRTARKLQRQHQATADQRTSLQSLVRKLAATAYGRAAGIEPRMKYAAFRERVPPQAYAAFAPFIQRMKRGEADVLWPGKCHFYATSAGTTGARKQLPVTDDLQTHFQHATRAALLYYTARTDRTEVFCGRHLFLGGGEAPAPLPEAQPFAAHGGDICGIVASRLPAWFEQHFAEPGREIAGMAEWTDKLDAIVERTWERDIRLIAGIPYWTLAFAEQMRARIDSGSGQLANLQALWPNLECLIHGGAPIAPFIHELRNAVGASVRLHEIYPATEGFIAAQDADSTLGLRLLADAGIFFEFSPLTEYEEVALPNLGKKAVPLEEVKPGIDYVVLLTTPAGLVRYALGDVVRFLSTEPPRLIYVGRTPLALNVAGERVLEKDLTDSLVTVCQHHGWNIVNFHVAPIFANAFVGQGRPRHEWWVELRAGTLETPTGPVMAPELDAEMQRRSGLYATKRKSGHLDAPVVRLVMPGVFEQWMRYKGRWGGQNQMPRGRPDREIADELLLLTRFAPDVTAPVPKPSR